MTTTTIKISRETHERLAARGRKGDSFDKIIRELLELAEKGGER